MARALASALVAVCVSLGMPGLARAQDLVFLNGGVGAGTLGLAGTASLSVVHGRTLYGVRLGTVEEFNLFGPTPSEFATDYAVLVGRVSRGRRVLRYGAVGLAAVRSVRRGRLIRPAAWLSGAEHERIERTTVGVPVELGVILHGGGAGIGVMMFGNASPAGSYVAAALTLHVGKMR